MSFFGWSLIIFSLLLLLAGATLALHAMTQIIRRH
jgi:hypothetical protein